MSWASVTEALWYATGITWLLYDIGVVYFNAERKDSISEKAKEFGRHVALLPYLWGVLAGHWWGWSDHPPFTNSVFPVAVMLTFGAILAIIHRRYVVRTPVARIYPLTVFLIGIPMGFYFWPL